MHNIDISNNKIKIKFDKKMPIWRSAKQNLKNNCVKMYKERDAIIYTPITSSGIQNLWAYAAARKDIYTLTDDFLRAVPLTIERDRQAAVKLNRLQSQVTPDTIDNRSQLLPHKDPQPFDHQRIGLEYAVCFPGFYTLDEMGLGKTRIAIERHWVLKDNLGMINKSLIVCPVSLLHSWTNEIAIWSDLISVILRGTKKQKLALLNEEADFFIINYEGINSIKYDLLELIDNKTNIILDEYIKIKNNKARRTKNVIELCDKTNYVHALCGTPITQGTGDVFAPSLAVDKGRFFGLNEYKFYEKYFYKTEYRGYEKTPKKNTPEIISKKIYQNAIRFRKKDCLDLPEKTFKTIELDLGKNKKYYDEMAKFAMTQIQDQEVTASIILVKILRLSQITSGFSKISDEFIDLPEQPKMQAVEDLLDSNNGQQVVVWSRFIHDVLRIARLCIKLDLTYGCLVGQNKNTDVYIPKPGTQRAQMLQDFKNEKIQIMIGTTQTGGLGINELARADRVIYYNNDYSYLHRDQSQDRTHRMGSVNNCLYFDLVVKNTIDVSILKILQNKKSVADIITRDNVNNLIGGEL